MRRAILFTAVVLTTLVVVMSAQQQPPPGSLGSQQPTRDTSAQQNKDKPPPTPTGRITGRVLASDNGRPVKRARVFVSAVELPGGRAALTDDQGIFDLTELPAGRYTLSVSKSGFVSLSYGQRRPLQAGTPLQLADGQVLKGVDFRLPRGSAIAGRVLDEDGDAMPGVNVRVMRYQYLQGERRLMPAGGGQTDDKGQYRVWGLMPGEYYVSAVARNFNIGGRGGRGGPGGFGGRGAPPDVALFGGRGGGFFGGGQQEDPDQLAYAPTYFPGVGSVEQAKPITVGLGAEVLDINFNMQLVRAASVGGHVLNPDATPSSSGNVNLAAETAGRAGQIGVNYGARIQWDGAFSIANVPPGRYVLRARGDDTDPPQFASQPITVNGQDMDDMSVILAAGGVIAGAVTFLPGGSSPPDFTQLRITAPSTDQGSFGPQGNVRVDKDGRFVLSGVSAGAHLIRTAGNMRGWILRSVTLNSRDITDVPLTIRSGETIANLEVVFTDKQNEINGTVTDTGGNAMPDFTILAFTTDSSLWRPQARQIATARPDQTGSYRIRGLPPGEYFVATVDPAEQGEWFEPAYLDEHRAGATRVTLGDGDVKTQNFKVSVK
jgi:hypothetical protein